MASNTVDPSNIGVGEGTISGYAVSNVSFYQADAPVEPNSPKVGVVEGVLFALSPENAARVTAWFGGSGFYSCNNISDASGPLLSEIESAFNLSSAFNPTGYWDCGSASTGGNGLLGGSYAKVQGLTPLYFSAAQ
jgi:hypothetical protein